MMAVTEMQNVEMPAQNEVERLDLEAQQKIDMKVCEEDQNCMRHVRIANLIRLHTSLQQQT